MKLPYPVLRSTLVVCSLLSLCFIKAHAAVLLPVEVIGADGYTAAVRFTLDDASGVDYLYLKIHRPAYRDALTNPGRGAKASVQLNEGDWTDLTNQTTEVMEPEASYGGMGGGFHTVRLRVPISSAQGGNNTLRFRFNGTDGFTSGYRVLEMNVLRGGQQVLGDEQFAEDDPATWKAPLAGDDVARGQELWNNKELMESPLRATMLKATCGDCHAHDGRDLKYFNYSNWSIEERSKFHGLNDTEARQIASYIRSLDAPAPVQARPWNPPYQPGPGSDSRSAEEWAAGAGLDAVLEKDADMLPYLFPEGTSEEAMARVVDTDQMLNLRELPLAMQFPDWNEWLPDTHPLDVFPGTFEQGTANQAYRDLRASLTANRDGLITNKALPGELNTLMNGTIGYFTEGQTDTQNWQWRAKESPVLNTRNAAFSVERAKEQLAKWVAAKSWEVMTEFRLQDVAPQIYERGEERAWPLGTRSVFNAAPHIVAKNKNHFDDQDALLGEYRSSVWYQVQMTLNAGQKMPTAEHPVDWPYQQKHVRELAERSEVWDGLRHIATNIKAYQERDNGNGPARRGWELRVTHPHWLYSNPNGDTRLMESLDGIQTGLRNRVVNSMVREFLEVVNRPEFDPENWTRCDHSESIPSTERWYCVEPEDHVPVAYEGEGFTGQTYQFENDNYYGPDKIFFFPENYHADNFYRLVPLLTKSGVDAAVMNELIDWCKRMWPAGDWDSLRPESEVAARVVLEAEDFTSRDGQSDPQGEVWQVTTNRPGYQGRGLVSTPSNTGQAKSGGFTRGDQLTYRFEIAQPTLYHVWVRRYARSLGSNSAYFGLDGVALESVDNQEQFRRWYWVKIGEQELSRGEHTLQLVRRENGYLVDQILFAADEENPNQSGDITPSAATTGRESSLASTGELQVFPNPVADETLRVSLPGQEAVDRIAIYTVQGKVLRQWSTSGQRTLAVDVSTLPRGMYVVKAYAAETIYTEKVLVE